MFGNNTNALQWVNGYTEAHLYHGIQLNNKKEQIMDTRNSLDEAPENYVQWKKPVSKVTYCTIPSI